MALYLEHEAFQHIGLKALCNSQFLQIVQPILRRMVTLDQCIVFPVVFVLRNGGGGVFGNQLFREAGNDLNLIIERGALCINGVCVQVFIMDHPAGLKQYLPVLGKVGNGPEKQPLDVILVQMRCAAAVFALEFAVATARSPGGIYPCCAIPCCRNNRRNHRRRSLWKTG